MVWVVGSGPNCDPPLHLTLQGHHPPAVRVCRQILACRRRIQKCMDNTPVSRVFHLGNEFHHLQQRVQSLRIRQALVEKKVCGFLPRHLF